MEHHENGHRGDGGQSWADDRDCDHVSGRDRADDHHSKMRAMGIQVSYWVQSLVVVCQLISYHPTVDLDHHRYPCSSLHHPYSILHRHSCPNRPYRLQNQNYRLVYATMKLVLASLDPDKWDNWLARTLVVSSSVQKSVFSYLPAADTLNHYLVGMSTNVLAVCSQWMVVCRHSAVN